MALLLLVVFSTLKHTSKPRFMFFIQLLASNNAKRRGPTDQSNYHNHHRKPHQLSIAIIMPRNRQKIQNSSEFRLEPISYVPAVPWEIVPAYFEKKKALPMLIWEISATRLWKQNAMEAIEKKSISTAKRFVQVARHLGTMQIMNANRYHKLTFPLRNSHSGQ
ncbi:hypothetical protein BS50DRAFT_593546 [Corynespora cassiicola Philippines]|uniref:Uncharacterized protein n=1 Tax=Corynespora cassiicola Philippines TaxID=1448308 RepID=A0A2T2N615_CORCC|nr:hypothetical protein BS50DRAFT_593546 [Corynespora cassiicola Philippines]